LASTAPRSQGRRERTIVTDRGGHDLPKLALRTLEVAVRGKLAAELGADERRTVRTADERSMVGSRSVEIFQLDGQRHQRARCLFAFLWREQR
jgi:hypothetical protein